MGYPLSITIKINHLFTLVKIMATKRSAETTSPGPKKDAKFTKLSQREHVLKRPDMYTGSLSPETIQHVVVNEKDETIIKDVKISPAFLQVVEEAVMNAADRVSCLHEEGNNIKIPTTKIAIDVLGNQVTVTNDGDGISSEYLDEHKMHAPELIFGNLLTSSNYNDEKKRLNVGRNGLGIKILNIFSTRMEVETIDSARSKKYNQVFEKNMSVVHKPSITKYSGKPYTRVIANIDLQRFGIKGDVISKDVIGILRRRAHEVQMCSMNTIKVSFNGVQVKTPSPEKYMSMYGVDKTKMVFSTTPRWKVAIAFTPENGEFKQYSFVNSTCTPQGGTHLSHVIDPVLKEMTEVLRKKFKSPKLRPAMVKECLTVVISAHIENPSFSSQTKDCLTLHSRDFGSSFQTPDNFCSKLLRCGVSDYVHELLKSKDSSLLKNSDGKKTSTIKGIPNLSDATWAGTKKSDKCYLMVTEGLSALTTALSATAVIGRDKYGCFPLKGKGLNVRDCSTAAISNNVELTNIKKILGLQNGMTYDDTSKLRYGGLIILSDQDLDGSHIRGLIINMFEVLWPSLVDIGFVHTINTPIMKATKGVDVKLFYNDQQYKIWEKATQNSNLYKVKYYKGLGGIEASESRSFFKDVEGIIVKYIADVECKESMSLAFSKDRAGDRKKWLMDYSEDNVLNTSERKVDISDFIHKELIHFSHSDNCRSISSAVDGLKTTQRKVLFGSFLKNIISTEAKVAQIAGFISDKTHYLHGETSMCSTIVAMAQNFVGSNNLELLQPKGQFGSRLAGGHDAASPRYIFVQMAKATSVLFPRVDESVLRYRVDEGETVEPYNYVPILPMILVNGCSGIGTGFSTNVPSYNPSELISNVKKRLEGGTPKKLVPFYNGFRGKIVETDPGVYTTNGIYTVNGLKVNVTELPIGSWSSPYKVYLEGLVEKKLITSYTEGCTDVDVVFEIVLKEDTKPADLVKLLKMTSTIRTSNMHLFTSENKIKKYDSTIEIEDDHFKERLELYNKRKEYQIKILEHESHLLSEKCRFFDSKLSGEIKMENVKYDKVIRSLEKMGFKKMAISFESVNLTFDYLTDIKLFSVTSEKLQALREKKDSKLTELMVLRKKSIKSIWMDELEELESILG